MRTHKCVHRTRIWICHDCVYCVLCSNKSISKFFEGWRQISVQTREIYMVVCTPWSFNRPAGMNFVTIFGCKTNKMYHTHQTVKIYCFLYSSMMISRCTSSFLFSTQNINPYLGIHTQFDFYPLLPLKTNKRTDRRTNEQYIYLFFPLLLPIIAVLTHSNLTIFDWMTPMRIKYDVSVAPNVHIISVYLVLPSSSSSCSAVFEIKERTCGEKTPTKCSSAN